MKPLLIAVMAFAAPAVQAAELIMVEQAGCHYCEKWDAELSAIYPKTAQGQRAPLRRVDLRALPADITFASRPVFTPTFVLVDGGVELGRMEGYNGDEFFWFLLGKMLDAAPGLDTGAPAAKTQAAPEAG